MQRWLAIQKIQLTKGDHREGIAKHPTGQNPVT